MTKRQVLLPGKRLCLRCDSFRTEEHFRAGYRICRFCISRAQSRRATTCPHPSIIKDKPGLTCTTCGRRWTQAYVHMGGRSFLGYSSEVK